MMVRYDTRGDYGGSNIIIIYLMTCLSILSIYLMNKYITTHKTHQTDMKCRLGMSINISYLFLFPDTVLFL